MGGSGTLLRQPRTPTLSQRHTPECPRGPGHTRPPGPSLPLPRVPLGVVPTLMTPRLTGADDFLNVDPGGLNLAGETTAHQARLLVGVGFCIELGLQHLPRGVVQGQEDRWRC